MTLTIRRATPSDWPTLVRFNLGLAKESEGKDLDEATLIAGVRAVLTDPQKGFYTIAESNGEPVGQMMVTFEWSDWRNGLFWWLQSVYVREDARQQGVVRALFEHLKMKAAADAMVIGFRLYVNKTNVRGQQVYRALGMVEEGYELMTWTP